MRVKAPLLLGTFSIVLAAGCGTPVEDNVQPAGITPDSISNVDVAAIKPHVEAFCGDCHGTPSPDTFPKSAWPREVKRGFDFYYESFREDLSPPPEADVIAYYQALAPQRLDIVPPSSKQTAPALIQFERSLTKSPELELPAVASIHWLQIPGADQKSLVFCDMRSGEIGSAQLPGLEVELLATLKNPARLTVCDLNGDGVEELVAAELGSFTSEDHHRGALVWLRRDATTSTWQQRLLVGGLGRVADVRTIDFDRDDDTDLIVAEFGHLRTGRIVLFENLASEDGIPRLREHVIDDRHGSIHVPVGDLDGDGRDDFVALISQEHELVEAYLNDGQGGFRKELIYAAGDPSYGSSGIELVDLDADGDLDVLYSNGDTFGSDFLKPYQGVTWLENTGDFPFTAHRLADMVGVQRAVTADVDGDDDLDIVAVSFMPHNLVTNAVVAAHDSVVWLEQTSQHEFRRHSLEVGRFQHAALEVGDFDGDGDPDLAVGNFQDVASASRPWVTVWWNQARQRVEKRAASDK